MRALRYTAFIVLLGMSIHAHAQQYFNERLTLNSVSTILSSVYQHNDKYYVAGSTLDSINVPQGYGYFGIEFSVFDTYGNILADTFYQKDGRNLSSWYSKLILQNDGSFLYAVDAQTTVPPATTSEFYLMIFQFDSLGRVLMEKEYSKPMCTGLNPANDLWRLTDFKPDGYGNWLMLSTIACSATGGGVNGDFLLTKLDSSFNVLWHKKYGNAIFNDAAGKILIEQDGYVISGGVNNANKVSKNFIFQAEIIKTDTAGNVQWTYLSPISKLTNQIQDIIKTQDGGYVYCGQGDGVENLFPNGVSADVSWKGWVEKIDASRNILWNKAVSSLAANSDATNQTVIYEQADSSLIIGGNVYGGFAAADTLEYNYGSLVKLTVTGNTIWERKYGIATDTLLYRIYDMKPTTDGGYILCGEARDAYYPYDAPTQRAWLLKVDSNGCMSATDPQCHPASLPEEAKPSSIAVYPNPAHETVFINYTTDQSLSFTLYDLMGRAVKAQKLHKGRNEADLRHLPAGVYLYKLFTENGSIIQQGKVVKE